MYANQKFLNLLALPFLLLVSPAWGGPPPNPTASDANDNTAGGTDVLSVNAGLNNTGFGRSALKSNTSGTNNTAHGVEALMSNADGQGNTANGVSALRLNTSGNGNTANGNFALTTNTTGNFSTASGFSALGFNTTGQKDTACGSFALYGNTTGSFNTALGTDSLKNSASGDNNLALGYQAGSKLRTGGNNVYLASLGANENRTMRLGSTVLARTYIAGVRGKSTGLADAVPVMIDSKGQLGTINSSARFKQDIQDMSEASKGLLKLRPVTFRYKESYEDGKKALEYGLIAEEVAKVYPGLVVYGADGKIETVQYQKLTPMLLNEVQLMAKESAALKAQLLDERARNRWQAQEIAALKGQMAVVQTQSALVKTLTERLARLEAQQVVGFNLH